MSFSGLWKCRPTAVLPHSASLARNTKPDYPWGFRDHKSTGITSHSSSDTRLFPPWLLAAIRVPARPSRKSPFCRRRLALQFLLSGGGNTQRLATRVDQRGDSRLSCASPQRYQAATCPAHLPGHHSSSSTVDVSPPPHRYGSCGVLAGATGPLFCCTNGQY